MKKLLEKSDLLAGIFGVLAIAAIFCEMIFAGFAKESIAGGIKDISGTVVDVLVLAVAASAFLKRKPKNISALLEDSVNKWGYSNCPLIFKVENFIKSQISNYCSRRYRKFYICS